MGEVFARRYELLDPIAEGATGSIWRVRDHVDGGIRAAKLLRHRDAGSLLRFMRELGTRIEHPHVLTPVGWVGEDDAVLFTMPLMRGGSVAGLVGDWGPLPRAWVVVLLDQLLSGLEVVHAAGVVHRDVKPANLLLEPTGARLPHLRLGDFGISTTPDQPRLTTGAVQLGTPGYLAPEQLAGAPTAPAQDLYAAATVGVELLVGHAPPFADVELAALAEDDLGRLLLRARDVDPARRPPDAGAFREALAPLLPTSWEPGEVEVLDHFGGLAATPDPPRVGSTVPPAATVVEGEQLAGSEPSGPSRHGADRAPLLLAAASVALLVLAAVLLVLG